MVARTFFTAISLFISLLLSGKEALNMHALNFIENKGQIKDQYGNARSDIQYKITTGHGLNIFIGAGALHYQWSNEASPRPSPKEREMLHEKSSGVSMYRMDVELAGANIQAEAITEEKQDYYERYYTAPFSPDKGGVVYSYNKITYKNIYPNIDWVLYIKDNKLEYDFVVRQGGDVKNIKLKYGGADKMVLDGSGVLNTSTIMGSIKEQKPASYEYENGKAIGSAFVLQDNMISFKVEDYEGTLIIDPTLDWATYYGALGNDYGGALTCDGQSNVYMTGSTSSINNIATVGAYQASYAGGNYDAFIVQFNSSGQRQWATYYGGSSGDYGEGIAYNSAGNIYVSGVTGSTSGIATSGSHQTVYGGGNGDGFLAKFNTAGALLWATYYGGSMGDQVSSVSCYGGDVYITGQTVSSNNIATSGSYQDTIGGSNDAYLAKFNASGTLIWATYYGGSSNDLSFCLSIDGMGNLYMCGYTGSSNGIATSGAYQTSNAGGYDAFLAKFDTSGSLNWATYYGGSGNEFGNGITTDVSGKVYLTGTTGSTSGIATSGAYQTTYGGGTYDVFLAQFDISGSLQWATYYGGFGEDGGQSVVSSDTGKIYITGYSGSVANIATSNSYQTINGGGTHDAFLAQFNSSGQRAWATYYGGSGDDDGYGMAADAAGNVYICGNTTSNNQIATGNAFQNITGGGIDAFLAKFKVDTLVLVGQPFTDTLFCPGDTFHLSYTTVDTFRAGNVFTAQLSDSTGSFANPANIGLDTATLAGSIFCTIPANTPGGNNYRIRIFSSLPVDTSKSDSLSIHIKGIPFHMAMYNAPLCVGDTLRLRDSVINALSYHWNGPNSINSVLQNFYISNAGLIDSGNYFVVDSFANGCKASDTVAVQIGPVPSKPLAVSNSPLCANDTLKLNASDNTAGVGYRWTGPNGFIDSNQNPKIAHAALVDSGKYIVKAVLNGCKSGADTIDVSINPLLSPAVTITSSPATINVGQTDTFTAHVTNCGNPVYQWYNNGIAIGGATGSTYVHALTSMDNISVDVHCSGGCLTIDSAQSNNLNTLVNSEQLRVNNIRIWPNPASSVLNIKADIPVNVLISGIDGRLLLRKDDAERIDINGLTAGLYLVKIYDSNMVLLKTEKLVKVL